jgi:hypothetical protein
VVVGSVRCKKSTARRVPQRKFQPAARRAARASTRAEHEEQHRCGWRLSLFLGDLRPCCSSARDRRQ